MSNTTIKLKLIHALALVGRTPLAELLRPVVVGDEEEDERVAEAVVCGGHVE